MTFCHAHAALAALTLVTSCEINSNNTKIQYMPDMADNPTFKAQETYLEPPEHSVAINGVLYPDNVVEAERELKNPYPASEQIIAEGKAIYEKTCIACHGEKGDGKNHLDGKVPVAKDFTTPDYKTK